MRARLFISVQDKFFFPVRSTVALLVFLEKRISRADETYIQFDFCFTIMF